MQKSIYYPGILLLCLTFLGCDTTQQTDADLGTDMRHDMHNMPDMITVPDTAPTFHRDIRPLMAQHCASCHVDGGVAPFVMDYEPMDWIQGAPWWAATSAQSVAKKTMPPWQPTQTCRPLHGVRAMPQDAVEKFALWAKYNFPEGDPTQYVAPIAPQSEPQSVESILGPPNLTLSSPQPFTPNTETPDDYRCFVLDAEFDQTSFVRAVNVNVDERAIVHHVIVYLIPPEDVGLVKGLDAKDSGAGYTCYGGPGGNANRNIGGWVPGSIPTMLAPGQAHIAPKGSKLVMQMHYNTLNLASNTAPADKTSVDVWLYPEEETPTHEIRVIPFANLELEIPAGEANSMHVRDYRVPFDGTLLGVTAHMHTLGKSIKLEHLKSPQAQNTCALDIPNWDFNWQQSYRFAQAQTIDLKRGDILRQHCSYDNSPSNQQVIKGTPRMPRRVYWGDGTLDEMCLTYAIVQRPYVPNQGSDCSINQTCIEQCDKNDGECLMRCAFYSSGECASCSFDQYFDCAGAPCLETASALGRCADNCIFENQILCLKKECATEWNAFAACATPLFKDQTCKLGVCGGQ